MCASSGGMPETCTKQPIHAGRPGKRGPAPRVGAAKIDGEQRIGEPAEPFEEIIRMPRPAPQADIADPVAVGRIGAEAPQLRIRQPPRRRCRRSGPATPSASCSAQTRPRIPRRKHHRQRQRNADQRLLLRQQEHLPRCVGAPIRDQLAVARIVRDADACAARCAGRGGATTPRPGPPPAPAGSSARRSRAMA